MSSLHHPRFKRKMAKPSQGINIAFDQLGCGLVLITKGLSNHAAIHASFTLAVGQDNYVTHGSALQSQNPLDVGNRPSQAAIDPKWGKWASAQSTRPELKGLLGAIQMVRGFCRGQSGARLFSERNDDGGHAYSVE